MTHTKFLAGMAVLLSLAAPAIAQDVTEPAKGTFEQMYAKKFVKHTPLEVAGMKRVKALDVDGDGYLTVDEIVAYEVSRAEAEIRRRSEIRFDQVDANGDGKLSAAEIALGGPVIAAPLFPPNLYSAAPPAEPRKPVLKPRHDRNVTPGGHPKAYNELLNNDPVGSTRGGMRTTRD